MTGNKRSGALVRRVQAGPPLLFAINEQERLERNKDAMRARLREILEKTEWETAAIRSRLVDTRAREFTGAVTFLVPDQIGPDRTTTNRTNRTNEGGEFAIIYS